MQMAMSSILKLLLPMFRQARRRLLYGDHLYPLYSSPSYHFSQ